MVYHITTKKRTYNSVDSAASFRRTRKITKDKSAVVDASRWDRKKQKWIPAGKKQFAP